MKKSGQTTLYRVLDANANRAREALRVCEDVTRFVLASPSLTRELKRLRHAVTQALGKLPKTYRTMVHARDSVRDCGKRSMICDTKKDTVELLFIRNIKRAGEATRVLEEFVKMIAPAYARSFQRIRFGLYAIEKKTLSRF